MLKKNLLLLGTIIILNAEESNNSVEIDLIVIPVSLPLTQSNAALKNGAASGLFDPNKDIDTFTIYITKDTDSQWIETSDTTSVGPHREGGSNDYPEYSLRQLIRELDWNEIIEIEERYASKKGKNIKANINTNIIVCESDEGSIGPYARYNGGPEELIQSLSTGQNDKWGMYDDLGSKWEQAGSCYLWNHSGEYYEWKKYKLIHDTVKKYVTVKVSLPYKVKFRPFIHRHSIGFRLIKILH